MMGIGLAVAAIVLGGAVWAPPPIPVVRVVRVYEAAASPELIRSSERMLEAVETGEMVDVEAADLDPADFAVCRNDPAPATCLSARLTAVGVGTGVVAVLLEPTADGFRWTCVGRDMNPFEPDHQVFEAALSAEADAGATARAAACLTYAGHQGGW